jgi:hypothetical protein
VSSYLLYLPVFFPTSDLTPYPAVLDYMARCAARPACPDSYKEALAGGWQGSGKGGGGGGRGPLAERTGTARITCSFLQAWRTCRSRGLHDAVIS